MRRVVLDASATIAFAIEDERTPAVRSLFADQREEDMFLVPELWRFEVANGLAMGVRRGRISNDDFDAALATLDRFPILMDDDSIDHAWRGTLSLARRHALTLYDAAYLELALRIDAELATLDRRLAEAAQAAGVRLAL